ncbi:hypothetical protein DFH28DRAFT_1134633 [Melampsora americana]|nr:hypothetical protein DFH28DRAFT_1134633 [Melampsora americana]
MERLSTRSSTPSLSLHHRNQLHLILQDPLPASPSHSPLPSPRFDLNRIHSQQSSRVNSRAPSPVPSIINSNRINSSNSHHHHHPHPHPHHHLINNHLINRSASSTPLGSPNSGSSLGITLPLVPNLSTRSNTPHYSNPIQYQNHHGSIEELEKLRRDHQYEIERLREESQSLKDEKAYLIAKNLRLERELKSINHQVINKPPQFQSHHSIQPLTSIDQAPLRRPSFNRSKSNPNVVDQMSNLSLSTHQIHHLHQLHRNASHNTTPSTTAPSSPKSMTKSRPTRDEEIQDYITLNSTQRPHHSRDSSLSLLTPMSNSSRSSSPNLKGILKKPSIPNLPHHQHGLARLAGIDQIGSHHSISHHQRRKSEGFGI